jgi:hypothetical protein
MSYPTTMELKAFRILSFLSFRSLSASYYQQLLEINFKYTSPSNSCHPKNPMLT